jgi:hypothetical protein
LQQVRPRASIGREDGGSALHPSDLGGRYPGGILVVPDGRDRKPLAPRHFELLVLDDVLEAIARSREAPSNR